MPASVAYRVRWQMSEADLRQLRRALEELPKRIRGKVLRKGLREWGNRLKLAIKRSSYRNAKRTRRDLAVKTKTYKRGRVIWCGVGVRKDGNRRGRYSHLYDGGWSPWPKGKKANRADLSARDAAQGPKRAPRNPRGGFVPFSYDRGWRKRIRTGGGARRYATKYLTNPATAFAPKAREYVEDAIVEALREATRGNVST